MLAETTRSDWRKWMQLSVFDLVHFTANCARSIRKAKRLKCDVWFKYSLGYRGMRWLAMIARSDEVAQLARRCGWPTCTAADVRRDVWYAARRIDVSLRRWGLTATSA